MNAGVKVAAAQTASLRLNLGAGVHPIEGYRNLDGKTGDVLFPLPFPDGSASEIRASHVLEHFSHSQIPDVLRDWVRVLAYDGVLKIAVPDFEKIAERYLRGEMGEWQGYIMGGHVDEADHHGAIFDTGTLTEALKAAGLRQIEPWQSTIQDCASLPISLNLQGVKALNVVAVMTVPRLGFMDNFFCAFHALPPLGIPIMRHGGAFWGQGLEKAINLALPKNPDAILTIDYDTVFKGDDITALIALMKAHPDIDALAPIQQARGWTGPLMGFRNQSGERVRQIDRNLLEAETLRVATAHFGCTLIRTSSLLATPRPWFKGEPAADGTWGEGHIDDDIWFWRQWEKADLHLAIAPRVVVGHGEFMIRWPDENFQTIYQHPNEFTEGGRPADVWK